MRGLTVGRISIVLSVVMLGGCTRFTTWSADTGTPGPAGVNNARLVNADREPGNWLTYGRTYSEQRFSPL